MKGQIQTLFQWNLAMRQSSGNKPNNKLAVKKVAVIRGKLINPKGKFQVSKGEIKMQNVTIAINGAM